MLQASAQTTASPISAIFQKELARCGSPLESTLPAIATLSPLTSSGGSVHTAGCEVRYTVWEVLC